MYLWVFRKFIMDIEKVSKSPTDHPHPAKEQTCFTCDLDCLGTKFQF